MQAFPHHYTVAANGSGTGDVTLKADELPTLRSALPISFDGPGDPYGVQLEKRSTNQTTSEIDSVG